MKVVHAACPHDCPDACAVLITVEEGRATRIQGDPAHPVTRGFLCAKVAKYVERVYSPARVLYPMKRVAPKGLGGPDAFKRIRWDEALDTIASRFRAVADEFGPEAILPYSYGGTLGTIQGSVMDHRFFHRLGASQLDRTICSSAGGDALISVTGAKLGTDPEQFRHSRYIIAWGANIHGNNIHLWPFIEEARRNGAKLVVIDPYLTRTARSADWYLPINPGTDAALALGMMNVIIGEGLYDAAYVAAHTEGFDELRERAAEYTPEKVERWTGISVGDIRTLAREYATSRPAVIRVNYGVQRCENGGMAVRAISMLPCITGAWKDCGGGLQLSTSGAFPLNKTALKRPDLMRKALGREARILNMSELGRLLNDATLAPPIKALFVFNSNPAAVCPDQSKVVAGLKREDLFTVVHEQFLTDTTDYADIVLPATTFFEHRDLQTAYGHYYLQASDQAIDPLGEARSNADVFRALAAKMGFDDECFRESDDEIMDAALSSSHPWIEGITRERLLREHSVKLSFAGADEGVPFLPFAEGFATASGKAALRSEDFPMAAIFAPPSESRHSELAAKYPLELLPRKADNYLNSTFCNLPGHQRLESEDALEISAADATVRGIVEGDTVRVFNDRGELRLKARIGSKVQAGVVAARLNWAKSDPQHKNVNVLTSLRLTDFGGGPTFYSTLVEVEKAD
jgi:anaerobic selenocysteine-containing dehydrogenase